VLPVSDSQAIFEFNNIIPIPDFLVSHMSFEGRRTGFGGGVK
jgi:hypothetical protein